MDSEQQTGGGNGAVDLCATESAQPPLFDLADGKRRIASLALAVSFIILFSALVQRLLVFAVYRFAPALTDAPWYTVVFSMLPMYLISMPLSLFFYRMSPGTPPQRRALPASAWFGLLAVCFTLTYAGNFLGSFVNTLIGFFTGSTPENAVQALTEQTPLWANLLFCGILAPILEEIFYRKLVIDRLRVFGELPAVLISGLLFGLIHGNFSQFFYATFTGFLLGILYLRTGRLRYTIGLHMGINLIGGVLMAEASKRLIPVLEQGTISGSELMTILPWLAVYGVYLLFLLACLVATPFTIFFLRRQLRFRRERVAPSSDQWREMLLLNPAVWLLLGVILMLFVI